MGIFRTAAIVRDCGPVVPATVEPKLYPVQCRGLFFRTLTEHGMAPVGISL